MRIDRTAFVALTAAIAACHEAERPGREPVAASSSSRAPSVDVPATVSPPATPSASAAPDGSADSDPIPEYPLRLRNAGLCEEQRFGPRPRGAEGSPHILDPITKLCDPLEHTNVPLSCEEGAFGCTTLANTLKGDAANRMLACLRAKPGTAICARGVVRECVVEAVAPTHPRDDVTRVCRSIAGACTNASKTLAVDECARFVSAMRKCHGVERAVQCLPDKCDVRACLDDWIGTWSY